MELNDIIKPENLVYEKPRLMNENSHALLPRLQPRCDT